MAEQDFIRAELDTMAEALTINLTAQAQRTAVTLEEFIQSQRLIGVNDTVLKQVLVDDLLNGGRIFGEYKRNLGLSVKGRLGELSNSAEIADLTGGDTSKVMRWITVEDKRVCPDCAPRHGQVETLATWTVAGRPRTGWSVCRLNCRCKLQLEEDTKEIKNPIKRRRNT